MSRYVRATQRPSALAVGQSASVGRPKGWTDARKRNLIKLYLCSILSTEEICESLKDGHWKPSPRSAQYELADLLEARPNKDRKNLQPNDRHEMRAGLAALRACRAIFLQRPVPENTNEQDRARNVTSDAIAITSTSIGPNPIWKRASSILAEVRSLKRISGATWNSDGEASVTAPMQENEQPGTRPNLLSYPFLIDCCCRHSQQCIHSFVASLVIDCPTDDSNMLYLDEHLANVEVNKPDFFGNHLIHLAAAGGATLPMFVSLIRAGADVNSVNAAGETVLHVLDPACLLERKNAFLGLCASLMTSNFNFDARDHYGKTVLLALLEKSEACDDSRPIEEFLASVLNVPYFWHMPFSRDNNGMYAAKYLVDHALESRMKGDSVRADWLMRLLGERCAGGGGFGLNSGLGVDAYDDQGYTPLMRRIERSRHHSEDQEISELVGHLLDRGASAHKRSRKGATALHLAVSRGLKKTTTVLINHGAKLSARTSRGLSVLAVGFKKLAKVKALAEAKALEAVGTREKRARASLKAEDEQQLRLYGQILACMMILIKHGAKAEPDFIQEWYGTDEPINGAESLRPILEAPIGESSLLDTVHE